VPRLHETSGERNFPLPEFFFAVSAGPDKLAAQSVPDPLDSRLDGAMRLGTRLFVDFWNFQLNWNERSGGANCDWRALPRVLIDEAGRGLQEAGITDELSLDETLVYASVKAGGREENLKQWLRNFLDRQPSFRVTVRERRVRAGGVWCNQCGTQTAECPSCGAALERSPEKGIDTAIATDLLSLAWEGALDIAVLVSGDSDFVPAVERIQERGLKVVNATWRNHGHELAQTCWSSIEVDSLIARLTR